MSQPLLELVDKERLWKRLEEQGYVDHVLDPYDTYTQDDLLDEAAELFLSKLPKQASNSDVTQRPVIGGEEERAFHGRDETNLIDDPVYKRGQAFTWYLLKLVAQDSMLKQFRERVLGGGTLSYDQGVALMGSPAVAVFSCDWFAEMGVPIVGHKAQILEGEWPPSEESSSVRGRMKLEWDSGELLPSYEGVAPFRSLAVILSTEEFLWRDVLVVLEDSVLGGLLDLAQHLSERFPWWGARWMPGFVLMGRAPIIGLPFEWFYHPRTSHSNPELMRRRSRTYQSITIDVPPWFSVESASRVYRSVKEQIPTKPQPSPRRLALFEFVIKHPEVTVPGEGQINIGPSWDTLRRSWNELLPTGHEWRYNHRGNFRRDFRKAFDQIVNYYR